MDFNIAKSEKRPTRCESLAKRVLRIQRKSYSTFPRLRKLARGRTFEPLNVLGGGECFES